MPAVDSPVPSRTFDIFLRASAVQLGTNSRKLQLMLL